MWNLDNALLMYFILQLQAVTMSVDTNSIRKISKPNHIFCNIHISLTLKLEPHGIEINHRYNNPIVQTSHK